MDFLEELKQRTIDFSENKNDNPETRMGVVIFFTQLTDKTFYFVYSDGDLIVFEEIDEILYPVDSGFVSKHMMDVLFGYMSSATRAEEFVYKLYQHYDSEFPYDKEYQKFKKANQN